MTHEKYGDYRDQIEKEVHNEFASFGFSLVHEEDNEPLEHGHLMCIFGWMQKSYSNSGVDALLKDMQQVCAEQGIVCLNSMTNKVEEIDENKAMIIVGAVSTAYWRGKFLKEQEEINKNHD